MIQSGIDTQIAGEFQETLDAAGAHFMNIDLFDSKQLILLLIRFGLNFAICWFIPRHFYYKKSVRKDYYFTFMMFSVTIFLMLHILQGISMGVGFALGLFCIFGMIKYRTESIQIREMTYLFVIIGVSAVNGLSMEVDWTTVIVANILFIAIIWALESSIKQTATKIVLYEKIALVRPDKYSEMLADLRERTGLDINKVEVGHIDFLRDVAFLKVYYDGKTNEINSIDQITKFS